MLVSPLNMISTPLAVLNTVGLDLRVGLSSEDPMVVRNQSEPFEAYLSIYSPEGLLIQRPHLGQIPANRRRFFDVSSITRDLVPNADHLAVIHRIPSNLASQMSDPAEDIEISENPDYSMYRSLVEYSYPSGGNGSVVYETPPRFNAGSSGGQRTSNTFTFTCQTVLSELVNTHVVLINSSMDPAYSTIVNFTYGLHSSSGELVWTGNISVGPFAISILDLARVIPDQVVSKERDPEDGVSAFTLVGYSEEASLIVLFVNAAPALGAVAVEHTHPPQAYMFPFGASYQRTAKEDAQRAWKSILSSGGSR